MQQSMSDLYRNLFEYKNMENSIKSDASELSHHIKLHKDYWGLTKWDSNNVQFRNPRNIVHDNEKLLSELMSDYINHTNKSPIPEKFIVTNNVILLQGINESIDRDIGVSSSSLNFSSLGTSATAELESQTDLIAEFTDTAYTRKQFSTAGVRSRTNQTMKVGMLWDDTDFDSVPVTIREAGIHWDVSAALKCHARVVSTDFSLDAGDLFVVQINELQENGTL